MKPTITFEEFLQRDCGGHPLDTIIDNLATDQIEEAAQDYAADHLSQHIQSEITFLEGLLPNVNDPAIEARIESLKKQLNEK